MEFHWDYFIFCATALIPLICMDARSECLKREKKVCQASWLLLLLVLVPGYALTNWIGDYQTRALQKRLEGFAPTYAIELESMGHERITEKTSPQDPHYLQIIERQKQWLRVNPTIADIYTLRKSADGKIALIVDSETDYDRDGRFDESREARTPIGEVFDKARAEIDLAFQGKSSFVDTSYSDRWGTWVSSFVPLRDSIGNVEAVLGVDYPAEDFRGTRQTARLAVIGLLSVPIALILLGSLFMRNRIQSRLQIENQRAQAIQSAKMASLGEMTGGMAHEINTPLAIIQLTASEISEMASSGQFSLDDLMAKAVSIEDTVTRISQIIRSMRTFCRDSSKDPKIISTIEKVVDDSIALCRAKISNRGVQLRIRKFDSIELECSPTQISQVLINLLNNSLDAIQELPSPWIELEVQELGGEILLSVTDCGPGIPPSVREKLMQPFFTTKEAGKGTGLGLSISRSIIEAHGGALTLDIHAPNTRFLIRLPKSQKKVPASDDPGVSQKAA